MALAPWRRASKAAASISKNINENGNDKAIVTKNGVIYQRVMKAAIIKLMAVAK